MGPVEEDEVTRVESLEDGEVDALERLADHLVAQLVDLGARVWVDRREPDPEVAVALGAGHELRGVPGADLDVVARPPPAYEPVEGGGVEAEQPDGVLDPPRLELARFALDGGHVVLECEQPLELAAVDVVAGPQQLCELWVGRAAPAVAGPVVRCRAVLQADVVPAAKALGPVENTW